MLVVIPRLPDLGSPGDVEAFWDENLRLMQVVILAASVGYLFLLMDPIGAAGPAAAVVGRLY
jgi:hypothetical protein